MIAILILCGPLFSYADSCGSLLTDISIYKENTVPEAYVRKLQNTLDEINLALLGKSLKAPAILNIEVYSTLDFSSKEQDTEDDEETLYRYSSANDLIYMYQNVIGPKGEIKDEDLLLNHFIHEYGHAILDANLGASKILQEHFAKIKRMGSLNNQLEEQLDVIYDLEQAGKKKATKEAEEYHKALNAQLMLETLGYDKNIVEVFEAYGEFYADLVVALFREDGSAMKETQYYEGSATADDAVYRDFSSGLDLETWQPSDGIHETLLPTRSFVWETYLKDGKVFENRDQAKFLKALTDALVLHIEKRLQNPEMETSTAESRNQWLIEDLSHLRY